ncbi:5-formyltetrahydrofolate cyclo-ligase [Streptomyces sp. AM 3-1-1]|uniref:5-formyltetrahydrofolate cyclo-ligase n=1 Tax=Streptomyces sp. AM 3-1-1 TaxID=3028711 RepID=UPI0023BA136A|nr:5-formyltetrahydrofolate cyclo-ligase [Streptomyces sp. AM 3-1-1]WEH28079.1 5-formyltetrahydrofolate cyclo-ligase [Streptomyces sp. AM 3-1-1]
MSPVPGEAAEAKRVLRHSLLSERRARPAAEVRRLGHALAEVAAGLPELEGVRTVAAYVSVGGEPDTGPLVARWHARGVRVLLPVLLPDDDLDWAVYEGPASLREVRRAGRMTLREPAGPRLGPGAVTEAGAVLLPGLAVDRAGLRLGRGGGSYDRVLTRLAASGADPLLLVLLYEEELRESVPAEPHDRPVHAAVTPAGVRRFGG